MSSAERSDGLAASGEAIASPSTLPVLSVRSRHTASAPVPPAASASTAPPNAAGALTTSPSAAAGCSGELGIAEVVTILRQLGSGMGPGTPSGSAPPHHAASGADGRAPPRDRVLRLWGDRAAAALGFNRVGAGSGSAGVRAVGGGGTLPAGRGAPAGGGLRATSEVDGRCGSLLLLRGRRGRARDSALAKSALGDA